MEAVGEDLGVELTRWVEDAVRRQRGGVAPIWDELTVRELPSLPSMSPTLSSRRRRLQLRFSLGPLSNHYPTDAARRAMDEIPQRLELAFADDILDGRAEAHLVDQPTVVSNLDEDGRATFVLEVSVTLYLRF